MKSEPLMKEKAKIERLKFLILKRQVENALKRLLKEIEKEKNNYKEKQEWKDSHQEFYEGVWHGLDIARVLVKKAFEGVVEG